jgi:hypothetical protein
MDGIVVGGTADRRLSGISNVGLSSGQYSTYSYTTTPENFISSITETGNAATVYPAAMIQTASYNNLNQLTDLSRQVLSFDADGNLLSDGAAHLHSQRRSSARRFLGCRRCGRAHQRAKLAGLYH